MNTIFEVRTATIEEARLIVLGGHWAGTWGANGTVEDNKIDNEVYEAFTQEERSMYAAQCYVILDADNNVLDVMRNVYDFGMVAKRANMLNASEIVEAGYQDIEAHYA